MTPADHAFVAALSAIATQIVADAKTRAMLVDCAAEVRGKVSDVSAMLPLITVFDRLRDCAPGTNPWRRAVMDLQDVIHRFHIWRLGRALETHRTAA